MRNGQNKRMRGRNRKGQNPLTRIYESNGPDVKVRGTASHVAEKYIQLARDAQASGDPVAAENYYQHAEHYFRLIAAAQEQFRQSQPYFRPESEPREDGGEDAEDDHGGDSPFGREPQSQPYPPREAQPYQREGQHYPGRDPQPYQPHQPREQQQPYGGRPPAGRPEQQGDGERLPSFITGSGPQPSYPGQGQNGFDGQPDRFPLHRRRRRRHGPRGEMPGSQQQHASGSGTPAEEPSTPPPGPSGGPTNE